MADWALFWFLLFAVAVLVLSWALFLTERERQRERAAKLRWKRDYYESTLEDHTREEQDR